MSRSAFREIDVKRAVRAATAAGLAIARVEIDREGKIVLVAGRPTPDDNNEVDAEFRKWEERNGQS